MEWYEVLRREEGNRRDPPDGLDGVEISESELQILKQATSH